MSIECAITTSSMQVLKINCYAGALIQSQRLRFLLKFATKTQFSFAAVRLDPHKVGLRLLAPGFDRAS